MSQRGNMPKGDPKPQTVASTKWQKKAGYGAKTFKLKTEVSDRFAKACERAGRSQASVMTELMSRFIEENS